MYIGGRVLISPQFDGLDIKKGKLYEAEISMMPNSKNGFLFQFIDDGGALRLANQYKAHEKNGRQWVIAPTTERVQ